jgi:hypothetical protein
VYKSGGMRPIKTLSILLKFYLISLIRLTSIRNKVVDRKKLRHIYLKRRDKEKLSRVKLTTKHHGLINTHC